MNANNNKKKSLAVTTTGKRCQQPPALEGPFITSQQVIANNKKRFLGVSMIGQRYGQPPAMKRPFATSAASSSKAVDESLDVSSSSSTDFNPTTSSTQSSTSSKLGNRQEPAAGSTLAKLNRSIEEFLDDTEDDAFLNSCLETFEADTNQPTNAKVQRNEIKPPVEPQIKKAKGKKDVAKEMEEEEKTMMKDLVNPNKGHLRRKFVTPWKKEVVYVYKDETSPDNKLMGKFTSAKSSADPALRNAITSKEEYDRVLEVWNNMGAALVNYGILNKI